MVQIYLLLADLNMHLHCHMFKSVNVALAYIFQIMVAHNQIYPAVQSVKHSCPLCRISKTKISQVKNNIILPNCIIPVGYNGFIHHIYILERSVAETDDIPMIKMGVRCKEHLAVIKFKIHFSQFMCITAR